MIDARPWNVFKCPYCHWEHIYPIEPEICRNPECKRSLKGPLPKPIRTELDMLNDDIASLIRAEL